MRRNLGKGKVGKRAAEKSGIYKAASARGKRGELGERAEKTQRRLIVNYILTLGLLWDLQFQH